MLRIQNFEKRYADELIIGIGQLELPHGIYWIKGENGAGKSTLFKAIAGLIPFRGTIAFENLDVVADPIAFRKVVNFAEAEPIYPGFLTAKDLIRFIGKAKGASEENMRSVTGHFGVDLFYDKSCETFSSGMLKKLSLTLAFLGEPKVIILDEPLITLDEATRHKLISLINTFHSNGVTFLLSSHQVIERSLQLAQVFEVRQKSIHRV
ncbi:MAG TPA: ATP-binding cassette domain-containing protein [Chryseosolibacter sp.]